MEKISKKKKMQAMAVGLGGLVLILIVCIVSSVNYSIQKSQPEDIEREVVTSSESMCDEKGTFQSEKSYCIDLCYFNGKLTQFRYDYCVNKCNRIYYHSGAAGLKKVNRNMLERYCRN